MSFIISSGTLLRQLKLLSGVIVGNQMNNILGCFLFELSKNELKITASDMETTLCSTLEVESEGSQKIAVESKLLVDTLVTFSEQPLTFNILKNNTLEIVSENGTYKISFFDGNEFPQPVPIEDSVQMALPAHILSRAISRTVFVTRDDDLRPAMSGVFFEFSDNGLNFVATDAHRLSIYKNSNIESPKQSSFIVHKKPLNLLKRILSDYSQTDVHLEYDKTNVLFNFDNVKLTSRLIDSSFPNYRRVIPKDSPNKLTINRELLHTASIRVDLYANEDTHKISLEIKDGSLKVYGDDVNFSKSCKENLSCSYQGDDLKIGFNTRSLKEMLGNLDSDEICIEMSNTDKAVFIKAIGNEEEKDSIMLLMPIKE